MRSAIVGLLCVLSHVSRGQSSGSGSDRGLLNRRPLGQHAGGSSPCWSGYSDSGYDPVDEDERGRSLLAVGAAGVAGAAVGYHLGMKHQNQPVINNNIYNEYPPPCVVVQGGGGGGGIGSGGGIIGGILGHHPILSNILQGGLWGGGGNGGVASAVGNRQNNINWNRAIRQFNRAVRPITRGFR